MSVLPVEMKDTKFSKFVDNRQIVWDASSLKTLTACPQLYKYKVVDGWRSKESAIAPLFGSAVHLGYEVLDTYRFEGKSKDDAVRAAIKAMLKDFPSLQESEDSAKNLETAVRAVVWRADEYYNHEVSEVVALPNGEPALEVRFELPLFDTGYRISGRIDKIAMYDRNMMYVVDTKTTGAALSDWYFNMFSPDTQATTYIWATREVLKLPVKGFMIDACTTGASYTRFARAPFNVNNAQIEEWAKDTAYYLKQVDYYIETDHWPQNHSSCGNYGGCQFRDICRQSPEHRQTWLEETFKLEPYGTREVTNED